MSIVPGSCSSCPGNAMVLPPRPAARADLGTSSTAGDIGSRPSPSSRNSCSAATPARRKTRGRYSRRLSFVTTVIVSVTAPRTPPSPREVAAICTISLVPLMTVAGASTLTSTVAVAYPERATTAGTRQARPPSRAAQRHIVDIRVEPGVGNNVPQHQDAARRLGYLPPRLHAHVIRAQHLDDNQVGVGVDPARSRDYQPGRVVAGRRIRVCRGRLLRRAAVAEHPGVRVHDPRRRRHERNGQRRDARSGRHPIVGRRRQGPVENRRVAGQAQPGDRQVSGTRRGRGGQQALCAAVERAARPVQAAAVDGHRECSPICHRIAVPIGQADG